jgi:hypothetical protein
MIKELEPKVHGGPSFTPGPMASSSKSKEHGPNVPSLDAKTEAIYAFRTITTMLSLIHSTRRVTSRNHSQHLKGSSQYEVLQLLDALSAVLVRSHGVIAVTAQPYDDSGRVEVLTSYLDNGESPSHTTSQPKSALHALRNVFVSQNPRNYSVKVATLVDPVTASVPNNFKKLSGTDLLDTFLLEKW